MAWTGDQLSEINEFLRVRYDMSRITALTNYKLSLLERIENTAEKSSLYAYAGGRGITHTIQTGVASNAAGRSEAGDFPLPGKTTFKNVVVSEIQYVATTGCTEEEQDEASKSEAGIANLIDIKLADLRNDIRLRLANGAFGDGTGRLATLSNYSNGTCTCNNTGAAYGWNTTELLSPGMRVDFITAADPAAAWQHKCSAVITSVNHSAGTFTIDTNSIAAIGGTTTGNPANGDTVFLHQSTKTLDNVAVAATDYQELYGLWGIIDDGGGSYATPAGGTARGNTYFGLDRTLYPSLQSTIYNMWDGTTAVSWNLETLLSAIRAVDNGNGGGEITALYAHPTMLAAIARKAAAANNITTVLPGDPKVKGGYYTRELNVEGRNIPLIPIRQRFPVNSILGVCENDLMLYQPKPIQMVNPYGGSETFFRAPNSRNLTKEAWIQFVGQLFSRRCDNHFKILGLRVDE